MIYGGRYRVITQRPSPNGMNVLVEDMTTGKREYRVIPLTNTKG